MTFRLFGLEISTPLGACLSLLLFLIVCQIFLEFVEDDDVHHHHYYIPTPPGGGLRFNDREDSASAIEREEELGKCIASASQSSLKVAPEPAPPVEADNSPALNANGPGDADDVSTMESKKKKKTQKEDKKRKKKEKGEEESKEGKKKIKEGKKNEDKKQSKENKKGKK